MLKYMKFSLLWNGDTDEAIMWNSGINIVHRGASTKCIREAHLPVYSRFYRWDNQAWNNADHSHIHIYISFCGAWGSDDHCPWVSVTQHHASSAICRLQVRYPILVYKRRFYSKGSDLFSPFHITYAKPTTSVPYNNVKMTYPPLSLNVPSNLQLN